MLVRADDRGARFVVDWSALQKFEPGFDVSRTPEIGNEFAGFAVTDVELLPSGDYRLTVDGGLEAVRTLEGFGALVRELALIAD